MKRAGIEETVSCIKHPDGDAHGEDGRNGKNDVVCSCEEPSPKHGDRWGIERKQMPELEPAREGICILGRLQWRGGDCGGINRIWSSNHIFILCGGAAVVALSDAKQIDAVVSTWLGVCGVGVRAWIERAGRPGAGKCCRTDFGAGG